MPLAQDSPLQLNEDRPFQNRFWRIQRVAWFLLAVVVALALAGLTGAGGPFSRASVSTPQGSVEYPAVARWAAEDEFTVSLRASASTALEIDRSFFDIFAIERIQPEPRSSTLTDFGQRLAFDTAPGAERIRVSIGVRAKRPGVLLRTRFRLADGAPTELSFIVLP